MAIPVVAAWSKDIKIDLDHLIVRSTEKHELEIMIPAVQPEGLADCLKISYRVGNTMRRVGVARIGDLVKLLDDNYDRIMVE